MPPDPAKDGLSLAETDDVVTTPKQYCADCGMVAFEGQHDGLCVGHVHGFTWVDHPPHEIISTLPASSRALIELKEAAERLTGCEFGTISWANAYDGLKDALSNLRGGGM